MEPNSTTAGTTMRTSKQIVPKECLIPCETKDNIAICKPSSADNKYITKDRKFLRVAKRIRGELCYFARGKHLTLEKARLIAGKVGELSETTDNKIGIMKGLIPFAAIFDPPRLRPILPVKPSRVFSAAEML